MGIHPILLADDDDALRGTLGEFLAHLGFQVLQADDGPSALELARRCALSFSILDFHMPGMTGLELLTTLRQERGPANALPCIMISADASTQDRRQALQHGAFRFLTKPFAVERLVECLGDTLRAFHDGAGTEHLLLRLRSASHGARPEGQSRPNLGATGLPAPLDLLFPDLFRPPTGPAQ